jgi:hypothetical protein
MFGFSSSNKQITTETIIESDDNLLLKQGIWAYFLLLIFEGALRKWFLPGLSTPLLVIRDPIAIWLIYSAWKKKLFPSSIYLTGMVVIGIVGFYLALFAGHGNIIVAFYGARILLLHFPLMFVIGKVFTREDVLEIGVATLWISIPMAMLIALQFRSPQSAWVNRGLAGDLAGAGFGGVGEFFRPPGTFSFTLGVSLFFGFLAPFVFYFWLNPQRINKLLLIAASGAMLVAIPFSISRTLFFEIFLTLSFALIATLRKPEYIGKIIISIVVGLVVVAFLSQTSYFKTAIGAFIDRFTIADEAEGGLKGVLGDRFLGGLISAIVDSSNQPLWGSGIGMGTNVGSMLLTGKETFLISEGEWAREVGELGPIIGIFVILLRTGLSLKLTLASYRKMIKGDLLAWLLLSFGIVILAQGSWAQPTALGFFVMAGGLLIASLQSEDSISESIHFNN